MKLSELMDKEIVNLYDGVRLGTLGDSDLVIDGTSGRVESIVLPGRGSIVSLFGDRQQLTIPWSAVRKIGNEVIIVDLEQNPPRRKYFV